MVLNRGGEEIKSAVLFGKYQIIRILGKGRSGTVYLARHLELEELRAIKEVPKSCACYDQFKKEALLLKRLRHPGIPIVYDLEEEEHFSYLIEEFLEGERRKAMIVLTKRNNERFLLNHNQIESIEMIPESKIVMMNRDYFIVKEEPEVIIKRIQEYNAKVQDVHRTVTVVDKR